MSKMHIFRLNFDTPHKMLSGQIGPQYFVKWIGILENIEYLLF